MLEDEMTLLRQAARQLRLSAHRDRALQNTPGILRAEIVEDLVLRIEARLALGKAVPPAEISSRTTEAMRRSAMFDDLYDAAAHLDELINVHGFTNSFRIWDGKRHCVFAKD